MNYQKLQDGQKTATHTIQGQGMYVQQAYGSNQNYAPQGSHNIYPNLTGYAQTTAQNTYGMYAQAVHTTQAMNVYESKPYTEDYSRKTIDNAIMKRTEVGGSVDLGQIEFDDYFEKHVEKFFTPEIQDINIYHYQGYIYGVQIIYRDSWGKTNKETFKGDLHMAPNVEKEHCERAKITLAYDEYIKAAFVEAGEYVTFLKLVTNKDQKIELGQQLSKEPKNLVPELGRVTAIAGTFNICLNSVYFYYT